MKKLSIIFLLMVIPIILYCQNLSSINPNYANSGETLDVTITGNNTHFAQGTTNVTYSFQQGSTTVINNMNIQSNTSIVTNITVPAATYSGNYSVMVYNSNDGYLCGFFKIYGQAVPEIVSLSPNSGNNNENLNVTITGANTHFKQGSYTTQVSFIDYNQGSPTTVNSVNAIDDYTLVANISIPLNAYSGFSDIMVYHPIDGELKKYSAFLINGIPSPFLTSASPNHSEAGQTLDVTITGQNTHFSSGSGTTVNFDLSYQGSSTLIVNSINVINETQLIANVSVPKGTYTGNYNIRAYNYQDGNLIIPKGFFIGLTGIAPYNYENGFIIAPNPAKDLITVSLPYFNKQNSTYEIYNLQGNIVKTGVFHTTQCQIDISSLNQGVYIFKAKLSNGYSVVKKFIVVK